MLIRLRETIHQSKHGNFHVYALNLNACQRISIIKIDDSFHLALGMDASNEDEHIIVERYDTEDEAINAFESLLTAFAEGSPLWDARTTRNK